MIYNKRIVAKAIQVNIKGLDEKIKNYQLFFQNVDVKYLPDFNHLVQWKNKNVATLHEMGHISDDEMEKYMTSRSSLFTPKIEIK